MHSAETVASDWPDNGLETHAAAALYGASRAAPMSCVSIGCDNSLTSHNKTLEDSGASLSFSVFARGHAALFAK